MMKLKCAVVYQNETKKMKNQSSPASPRAGRNRNLIKGHLTFFTLQCSDLTEPVYTRNMELILVFGLDVPLEVTGSAECFVTMRTMRPLSKVDSLDVGLEVTGLAECFVAMRTLERPQSPVDSLDMLGNATVLHCFIAFRTLTRVILEEPRGRKGF